MSSSLFPTLELVDSRNDSLQILADSCKEEAGCRLTFAAADGNTHAVEWTIAELEQKHRGTLVNLDWLEELTPWFTGRVAARLKDEKRTELIAARDRVRLLKRHLGL